MVHFIIAQNIPQLFTVHIFKNEYYVPLSYFLLPDKITNTYATAFKRIIKTRSAQNVYFNPTTIVVDNNC
jgi:hypothetical protein